MLTRQKSKQSEAPPLQSSPKPCRTDCWEGGAWPPPRGLSPPSVQNCPSPHTAEGLHMMRGLARTCVDIPALMPKFHPHSLRTSSLYPPRSPDVHPGKMPARALEAGSRPGLSGQWNSGVLDTQVDVVKKGGLGASLVVQWLRIHLPMQGTQV